MHSLKLTNLFSKAHVVNLHYGPLLTSHIRQSQEFEWVTEIGSNLQVESESARSSK